MVQITINKEMAKSIYTAFRDIQGELSIPGQMDINTLAEYRDLLIEENANYDIDALYAAFREAVSCLEAMRIREGGMIAEEQRQRAASLKAINDKIKFLMPSLMEQYKTKFSERLRLLFEPKEIDSTKVIQEASVVLEKLDISEEVN